MKNLLLISVLFGSTTINYADNSTASIFIAHEGKSGYVTSYANSEKDAIASAIKSSPPGSKVTILSIKQYKGRWECKAKWVKK